MLEGTKILSEGKRNKLEIFPINGKIQIELRIADQEIEIEQTETGFDVLYLMPNESYHHVSYSNTIDLNKDLKIEFKSNFPFGV